MNRAKYLLVFLSGIILYIGLSLFWGENSFKNYSSLVEQKKAIVKHKVDLEDIYTELSLEVSALYNDKAIIHTGSGNTRKSFICNVWDDNRILEIVNILNFGTKEERTVS